MAPKGSIKYLSVQQEDMVAKLYGGLRSGTSGAAPGDGGDVRIVGGDYLIECKLTGGPGDPVIRLDGPRRNLPKYVRDLSKVVDEARPEGKEAFLVLSFFQPDSNLADHTGWIHLVVRQLEDDLDREPLG